ncbi:MFS transporter [Streptomyces xantholiticus]|uniref:MFS transporter n=1 Tax=Streptomyces xantholiticus TaxID=68285 RepID=UPI001671DD1A|nr:MFS transporter [Streptomyces xantholiticus]GGW61804.1 MFS transporter [Streptomyces xantholiticus]
MSTLPNAVTAPPRRGLILLAVCLAVLMVPVSLSGTSVALPAISRSLHADIGPLQWAVNGYNVTAASFMLAAGSLADIVGRRRMFALGAGLFGASSLACALAQNIYLLDVARALAGVGSASLITAGTAIIATAFDGEARNRAFAVTGVVIGAGLAIGPTSSGWIISLSGWRGIFLSQLFIAVVVLAMLRFMPESRDPEAKSVDWVGTGTFTSALFVLTVAVAEGARIGWTSPAMVGLLVVFLVLIGAFVGAERRHARPMFDVSLFRQSRFVALCMLPVIFSFGFVGFVVLMPSYLIGANGRSSGEAGLAMLLLTGPVLVVPLLASKFLQWGMSSRILLTLSLLVTTAGVAWLTVIEPGMGWGALIGPMVTIGVGQGLSSGLMDGAAISSVPPARAGMAAGMFNTMRLAGEAVAIAAMGGVLVTLIRDSLSGGFAKFQAQTDSSVNGLADSVASGNAADAADSVSAADRATFIDFLAQGHTDAMHLMLWSVAALCAVATVAAWFLLAERPAPGEATAEKPTAEQREQVTS